MKISARNQIKGTVLKVEPGIVSAIVTLDVGNGNQLVASITMDSVKNLDLKPGAPAYAIIKASSVMIGVD
jgi:molybdopterin-binding protein